MSVQEGICFICRESVEEGKVVSVKKRGIETLINVSVQRGLRQNQEYLKKLNSVIIHDSCRKKYTVDSNVKASVRRGGDTVPEKLQRKSRGNSILKNICCLCGEAITEEFRKLQAKLPKERRNIVYSVTFCSIRETFLERARLRDDEWGNQIITRLESETDLVAAEAIYHEKCRVQLYSTRRSAEKRGRPVSGDLLEGMNLIYSFIEENREDCQFSLSELLDQFPGDYRPDTRSVKAHLEKQYGEKIFFCEVGSGHKTVVCFRDVGERILYDNWYNERKSTPEQERLRVVKAAANIILSDIRSQTYDTTTYPPSDDFFRNTETVIPDSLREFLEILVMKHKRNSLDNWRKKSVALAHAIMSAVRPRSFLSNLQVSVGTYLYRKFGSKHLVNLCASIGFSCSYTEAVRLESSAIVRVQDSPTIEKEALIQFVFDNADVNVNTIDGENTFHEMGGIMIITPKTAVLPDKNIPRLSKCISADSMSSYGTTELKQSTVRKNAGLTAIPIMALNEIGSDVQPSAPDLLWLYGKSFNKPAIPGWNGFMEQATNGLDFNCSKIIFLPFIHAPPTDYDTVLTSLLDATKRTADHFQKTCFVTFDQPLYMKARDIIESCQYPQLSSVVVRLGGFHLLMSFMGAIGAIMAGSGLKELLTTIYANNSVDKILNGHAYSRAIRAHMLCNLALASLILKDITITDEEQRDIDGLLDETERSKILLAAENEIFQLLSAKFKTTFDALERKGPTAQLWIQYFKMTTLIKKFIQAERSGDWDLHLETVTKMLPFFHSAGHFFYAKSSRLYLQDMNSLKDRMDPKEFRTFTQQGEFTVRRSNKFWSGLWTDLTIEQVLMRSMKTQGGLTHGRGVTSSVLSRWTMGMVYMLNICEGLEQYWGVSCTTSEQHVDMRPARISRDNKDVEKLKVWFGVHEPFSDNKNILSISSGIVGGSGTNCHRAQALGLERVQQITGQTFGKVSFKRKDKVVTLASTTSSIKVANKKVNVDPLTIFQRLCITKQSDQDLRDHFKYELAPFPMALFSEEGMRKGTKSNFYSAFIPANENLALGATTFVVVDGGYLVHKVIWHRNDTIRAILEAYTNYVSYHFGKNVAVIFDGYPEDGALRSTKTAERLRRYGIATCQDIMFEQSTCIKVPQEKMLSNTHNKRRLIDLLCSAFKDLGIETKKAAEDADCDIIKTALSKSSQFDHVVIIGEDVDLVVLLNGLGYGQNNVYFQKSGRGECVQYSSTSFDNGGLPMPPQLVLFYHAFTGCDTTSAAFWKGKTKIISTFKHHPHLVDEASVFINPGASHEDIEASGARCLAALYGGDDTSTLHGLRYELFVKAATNAKVDLARLPPTEDSAKYHAYRTYHQVQQWLGEDKEPTEWGWSRTDQGLLPIMSKTDPAPRNLMKMLSCRCKKGCAGTCSCMKAGLKCSVLCTFCEGKHCKNQPTIELDSENEAMDEELFSHATEYDENECYLHPDEAGPSKKFKC